MFSKQYDIGGLRLRDMASKLRFIFLKRKSGIGWFRIQHPAVHIMKYSSSNSLVNVNIAWWSLWECMFCDRHTSNSHCWSRVSKLGFVFSYWFFLMLGERCKGHKFKRKKCMAESLRKSIPWCLKTTVGCYTNPYESALVEVKMHKL